MYENDSMMRGIKSKKKNEDLNGIAYGIKAIIKKDSLHTCMMLWIEVKIKKKNKIM